MISPSSLFSMPSSNLNGLPSGLGNTSFNPNAGIAGSASLLATPSPSTLSPSTLGGVSSLGGDSGVSGAITQILSMLTMMLSMLLPMLMQLLGGNNQQPTAANDIGTFDPNAAPTNNGPSIPPGLSNKAPTAPAGNAGPAPTDAEQVAGNTKNSTSDPAQKQRLNTILGKVAKDPEGNKLLKAAQAKGYTIEVGDPGRGENGQPVNGITKPDEKKIIINPNAPEFDKTVVHELVHAATEGDGNSQTEEGMADVIGYRISSRIDGKAAPGSEQQIFNNKIRAYPNLQGNNDIMNSLSQLGISA